MEYDASELGAVDAVEVVDLRDVLGNRASTFMEEAQSAPCVRVTGETAQKIAQLWHELPDAEQMRCHVPPFGLRFFREEKRVLQASICWHCNNIFIDKDGENLSYKFDGRHQSSQQLFAILQNIMS